VLLRTASLRMMACLLIRSVMLRTVALTVSPDAGESVDTISDSPDGAGSTLEHEFSVASISVFTDAGDCVVRISDSQDCAGSSMEHEFSVASLLIRSVTLPTVLAPRSSETSVLLRSASVHTISDSTDGALCRLCWLVARARPQCSFDQSLY
jgi:hypothetical protein